MSDASAPPFTFEAAYGGGGRPAQPTIASIYGAPTEEVEADRQYLDALTAALPATKMARAEARGRLRVMRQERRLVGSDAARIDALDRSLQDAK
jgi:hypothetical protein